MKLDELKIEWENDTKIGDDLGAAAIKCSLLHSKYLSFLIDYKLRLTKAEAEIAEFRAIKTKYYRGEMTRDELQEHNLEQWQYKTLKSEIPELIEADAEFQKLKARESYIKTAIYFLESVLGEIKTRNFAIRASIDWIKFRAGS